VKKFFLILLTLYAAGGVFAQDRQLSLDDALRLAVNNSLDIQIAQYDLYIKQNDLPQSESIFDTYLTAQAGYDANRKKSASAFLGSRQLTDTHSVSLSKKLPTGTDITASLGGDRVATDSPYTSINPYHELAGEFSLRQPLGKNFFGLADRAAIKITRLDIDRAGLASLDDIEAALYAAAAAYWNLVLKDEELKIELAMLKEARRLYRVYKGKYKIGTAEKSAYLAIEAGMKERESDVFAARTAREQAKNDLLFLLNDQDLAINILPGDGLAGALEKFDLARELGRAVAKRRDYRSLLKELKARKIDLVVKKNALWPQIDLLASYRRNGLDRKMGAAVSDAFKNDHADVYVGLNVEFSLENRFAKAGLKKSQMQKARLLLLLKRLERYILKDVTNRVKEVNDIVLRCVPARRVVELQEEKLKAELESLKYGRSSADIIVRYEDDLLAARLAYARLLFSYRVQVAALELAQNSLLDKYWPGERQ